MTTEPNTEQHTYWISIGRGTRNNGTLSDGDWAAFQYRLASIATRHGGEILSTVNGHSAWEGVAEETCLILVTIPAERVQSVRFALQALAVGFAQDAIGIVGGPGTDTLIRGE